jgi:hypothetical protein
MKRFFILSLVSLALITSSCSKHTAIVIVPKNNSSKSAKSVPPGQAKKASGSQSAKQFAPGQQKKK